MKVMIKLKGTVRVGALKLCHECNVDAIRDMSSTSPRSKTYYVPLTILGAAENRLSMDILCNLCTHEEFEVMYHCLDMASTEAE